MLLHRPAPPLDPCVDYLWAAERGALPHARERHEFRRFAGMPPSAYRPPAPDHRNHVALATPAEKSTRRLEPVEAS